MWSTKESITKKAKWQNDVSITTLMMTRRENNRKLCIIKFINFSKTSCWSSCNQQLSHYCMHYLDNHFNDCKLPLEYFSFYWKFSEAGKIIFFQLSTSMSVVNTFAFLLIWHLQETLPSDDLANLSTNVNEFFAIDVSITEVVHSHFQSHACAHRFSLLCFYQRSLFSVLWNTSSLWIVLFSCCLLSSFYGCLLSSSVV